jgi:tetratricopeptide (TPR) repeat protein
MRKIFVFILLISVFPWLIGQESDDFRQRLYHSYVKDEMHLWKGIIEEMNQEYALTGDEKLLYELCFARYGYIGYLISEEEDKAAKKRLREAEIRTEELGEILNNRHDVMALQGALLGYRIVLSKFSSIYLGPRALKYIETAYESADTCFNCNVEMGNRLFYIPKFLGGSKIESIPYYEKAVEILESSSLKTERNWIYMNTVLMLANVYKETDQMDRACLLYEHLLEYEPKAEWVRIRLYAKCK